MINLKTQSEKNRSVAIQTRITIKAERKLNIRMLREMNRVAKDAARRNKKNPSDPNAGLLAIPPHIERVAKILRMTYGPLMTTFSVLVSKSAQQKNVMRMEVKDFRFNVDRMILSWMGEHALNQSVLIGTTTGNIIKKIVLEAEASGLTVAATSKLILDKTGARGIGRHRANMIARTEAHSAAQQSSLGSVQGLGLDTIKEWVAVSDDRTRDSHMDDADGLKVPTDKPFSFAGLKGRVSLDFCGDPNGPPEETINCRCAMVYATVGLDSV